jgi:catalase
MSANGREGEDEAVDFDLTTIAGAPVVDNQNVVNAGPRGSVLLQDVWFLEKLQHFDREVIPERCMHAKRFWRARCIHGHE